MDSWWSRCVGSGRVGFIPTRKIASLFLLPPSPHLNLILSFFSYANTDTPF